MLPRSLSTTILSAVKTFPAVVVTGPRQSGKTTLLKSMFSRTHRFVSLENIDARLRAKEDPIKFLEQNPPPVILDEIQYAPDLLSYIKTKIDEHRKPGQWLFTGSQNFVLMQGISQSLAGRIAVLSLLPFSYCERIGNGNKRKTIAQWLKHPLAAHPAGHSGPPLDEIILRGNYPEIAVNKKVKQTLWCASYIATYLERDVRNITQIGDLGSFERFLTLCAIRTGQILNLSEIAREVGITVPTAKKWFSILEASYLAFRVHPYYRNIGKRLIKSPKFYFCDTALAAYLLGLRDAQSLFASPHFGSLFETFIVTDFIKRFLHEGDLPRLYYLRTADGLEIDLVLEEGQKLNLFEIKSSMTIVPQHAVSLKRIKTELPNFINSAAVISQTSENFSLGGDVMNYGWRNILAA